MSIVARIGHSDPAPDEDAVLTYGGIYREVTQFKYKPNYEFALREDLGNFPTLVVAFTGPDSRRASGPTIKVAQTAPLPPPITLRTLKDTVRRCIHTLELHEADEWLSHRGELVNDPHEP